MKFSIITITYNRAHLIAETIESVLNQTYQNFEHIIIDDGSTDNTEEVVNSFNDKRIKYYKYSKNGNLSILWNLGFKYSTGSFLSILDSDDIWHKERLQNTFDVIQENKGVQIIMNNLTLFNSEKTFEQPYFNFKEDFNKNILIDLLNESILTFPVFTFSKKLLKSIGSMDETIPDGQYDLYLRICSKNNTYYINKSLLYKRVHNQNISNTENVINLLTALKTLNKLKNSNHINEEIFQRKYNSFNYKIAKYYFDNKENKKSKQYLNKVIKQTSLLNKLHLKSMLFKFSLLLK